MKKIHSVFFGVIFLIVIAPTITACSTRNEETNKNGANPGIVHVKEETRQALEEFSQSEQRILNQIVIQQGGNRFVLQNLSSKKPLGLVSDIENLLWIAPRGGAGIEPEVEERKATNLKIIQESNESTVSKNTWVRLYYQPYKPVQGMNYIGHKDIIVYIDPDNNKNAYLGIQNPDNQTEWNLFLLPGYGQWLQKEIDMLLRLTSGI